MMEKEPQISRQSQTWHVPCENGKQTHREATEKIQISIMLISNNKTIPFNYYLLAIQCEVEGFFVVMKEASCCFLFLSRARLLDEKSYKKRMNE